MKTSRQATEQDVTTIAREEAEKGRLIGAHAKALGGVIASALYRFPMRAVRSFLTAWERNAPPTNRVMERGRELHFMSRQPTTAPTTAPTTSVARSLSELFKGRQGARP